MRSLVGRCCLGLLLFSWPGWAAILPAGFEEEILLTGGGDGIANVTSFTLGPEADQYWITAKDGRVWFHDDGDTDLITTLAVSDIGERGIHGIELDPDYDNNNWLWLYYTTPEPAKNRLVRFTIVEVNDLPTLTNETVVFETPELTGEIHNGGCIRFGSDETIYLSTGNDNRSSYANDPFDVRAKMIRINRDGTPPGDNPWFDGVDGDPRVWAWGFRNPFRFGIQPGTDNLFVGDVGAQSFEEISLVVPGAFHGYPAVEGPQPPANPGSIYPVLWYDHLLEDQAAVIAGDFIGDTGPDGFPEDYHGNFFFADYPLDTIYRVELDENNQVTWWEPWAVAAFRITELRFNDDGYLYYLSRGQSRLNRISFVGGANRAPFSLPAASPASGPAPLTVTLDGSGSTDPDDDTLTYDWDLGDGTNATGVTTVKSYPQGIWDVVLTVDDGNGEQSDQSIHVISGNDAPTGSIDLPMLPLTYSAGDTINYSGSANDGQDGALGCAQQSWTVVFHHLDHTHPFLGPLIGDCSGSFTIPTNGETSEFVWYRLYQNVEDLGTPLGSDGILESSTFIDIFPNLADFTLASVPGGLDLTLDGQAVPDGTVTTGVVGLEREIGTPETQLAGDGHTYRWLSWAQGGARDQVIATPTTATTYTANFVCDVIVEAENVVVAKATGGALKLNWSLPADTCFAGTYRVYAASTATPTVGTGSWPTDPNFRLVGETSAPTLSFVPNPDDNVFIVVGVGTDGLDGRVGHYFD